MNSRLTKEEQTLTDQLLNDIKTQLISLRMGIGNLESQIVQSTNEYSPNHGAVINLKEKLRKLKNELNDKVSLLISQGQCARSSTIRQDIITQLLELDSEIIGFELKFRNK